MRVLIVKLSSLGDVVHTMPVVHDIRTARPDAVVDWVVEPAFAPLVRRVAGIGEVIECAERRWRDSWLSGAVRREFAAFRERLRRDPYDAVIDLQGLMKSAMVAKIARGLRFGIGNATEGSAYEPMSRWLLDHPIAVEKRIHAMDRARAVVAGVFRTPAEGPPVYGLAAAHPAPRADQPTVVFVHGTSRDDKLWPVPHWVQLGKRFLGIGWRIVLPQSNESEQTRAEMIAAALQFEKAPQVEVWPSLQLGAVLDRIAGAQSVVGVDSGLSHVAVALDLPHVQVYNHATSWRTGPQPGHGHRHQVSVEGQPTPSVDAVWSEWRRVYAARHGAERVTGLARAAYSALWLLLAPFAVLRLWWRGRREPLYRHAIGERFGRYRRTPTSGEPVWVHAVSLGETRAAAALIAALRERLPAMRLLLTHGTATGREAGAELLQPGDVQVWLPWDTPGATRRFLRHWRPAVGVLMETEVWPGLLAAARAARVPMVLANARLSERSLAKSLRLDALMRPAVQGIAAVLAQTEADAARLRQAGARDVRVLGNLKFDMAPDAVLVERGRAWRALLQRPVALFAASREGEEAGLLAAWATQRRTALLLIVPRHPQRFDEVAAAIQRSGLACARRSGFGELPPPAALASDVWLGDSMREMPLYYGSADVALLGGSFAPLGGQNLIEAAACGCPVVMGPHTFNFAEAAEHAVEAGAALRVPDIGAALHRALELIDDTAGRNAAADRARAFAALHRGAAARLADAIVSISERADRRGDSGMLVPRPIERR